MASATRGVIRPPSRGPFLIRGEGRLLHDVRVEVGTVSLTTCNTPPTRLPRAANTGR
jgi:hypothetical protein